MKLGINRRVDDLVRIAIPKELRQAASIDYGDVCNVSLGEQGTIIIQKQTTIPDVSGEIERIKNALLDTESAGDIREEAFKHLNKVEELIKTVRE